MSTVDPAQSIVAVRKITTNGRTSIPHQIRYKMGIDPGDEVKFVWDGEELKVIKTEQ